MYVLQYIYICPCVILDNPVKYIKPPPFAPTKTHGLIPCLSRRPSESVAGALPGAPSRWPPPGPPQRPQRGGPGRWAAGPGGTSAGSPAASFHLEKWTDLSRCLCGLYIYIYEIIYVYIYIFILIYTVYTIHALLYIYICMCVCYMCVYQQL